MIAKVKPKNKKQVAKVEEPRPDGPWIVHSLGEVAKFFGVTRDCVRRDWRTNGMPGDDRYYDLSAIARWRITRAKSESRPNNQGEDEDRAIYKRRDVAAMLAAEEEARGKKLANDLKAGRLLPAEEVHQQAAELCIRLKQRLEAAPDEMEMEFPKETRADNKARFEDFIRQLLLEVSSWDLSQPVDDLILSEDD